MITRKRTTISFSEKHCRTLEKVAENLGIDKPTIPAILAYLIADTPEFKAVLEEMANKEKAFLAYAEGQTK